MGFTRARWTAGLFWLLALLVWLDVWDEITQRTWGAGPSKVLWMALALALVLRAPRVGALLGPIPVGRSFRALLIALFVLVAGAHVRTAIEPLTNKDAATQGVDMALNTVAAGDWFLQGKNPYVEKSQLQHRMQPGPNLTVEGDSVRMYGLPYTYGYPYFPMMFLSYLPFRLLMPAVHSIRLANLPLIFVNAGLLLALLRVLVRSKEGLTLGWLAAVASLAIPALPGELFNITVTDLVIGTYALAAWWCLSRQRYAAAGVFFGLAQACKLLPGALLIAPVLLWLFRRPGFWPLLAGFALTCLLIMGPFIVWAPAHFLSSTILLYQTHHAGGDNSSLWFVLPSAWKGPFTALGVLLTLGLVLLARWRRDDVAWPMVLGFASYFTFIAFARMIHLNYFWSCYPLACAAFFVMLGRGRSMAAAASSREAEPRAA